jgi:hypothetical protein
MERTPRAEMRREAVRDVLVRFEAAVATQPEFDRRDTDRTFRLVPLPPIHWRGSGTNTGIWAWPDPKIL